jgi:hypothetical protein
VKSVRHFFLAGKLPQNALEKSQSARANRAIRKSAAGQFNTRV